MSIRVYANGRKTRTYTTWVGMRVRCNSPQHKAYPYYGGRGIKICDRWNEFENFLADMGERPRGTTLDRIDNEGHYEPRNCRWATPFEQQHNTRRANFVTFRGETLHISEWARRLKCARSAIRARLAKYPAEVALAVPINKRVGRKKLTAADVSAIRADTRLQREIGADYGIQQTMVSKIKRGYVWRKQP